MKDLKNKIPNSKSWIFLLLICIITCFMSIGFAQINILLGINGTAITVLQDDIFITDVNYLRSVNADLNNSQILDMYQTNLSTSIALSKTDPNSSITYAIEIYNPTSSDYKFEDAKHPLYLTIEKKLKMP